MSAADRWRRGSRSRLKSPCEGEANSGGLVSTVTSGAWVPALLGSDLFVCFAIHRATRRLSVHCFSIGFPIAVFAKSKTDLSLQFWRRAEFLPILWALSQYGSPGPEAIRPRRSEIAHLAAFALGRRSPRRLRSFVGG